MDQANAFNGPALYVEVVVEVETARIPQPFTYSVPAALRETVDIGSCVLAPFAGRELLGYVVAVRSAPPDGVAVVKDILDCVQVETLFGQELAEVAEWMSHYYHCGRRDALRPMIPKFMASSLKTIVGVSPAVREIIAYSRLLNAGKPVQLFFETERETVTNVLHGLPMKVSPKQKLILQALTEHPDGIELHALTAQLGVQRVTDTLKRLQERGLVTIVKSIVAPQVQPKKRKAYRFVRRPGEEEAATLKITEKQAAVLRELERLRRLDFGRAKPVLQTELRWRLDVSTSPMDALVEKGLLEAVTLEVRRDPWPTSGKATSHRQLSPDQETAYQAVCSSVEGNHADRFLLHGVTASGKTEVYLQSIQAALDMGRQSIVLVPEISLTSQVMDIFQSRFGGRVAVLHSALSDGERYDEWRRIRRGEAGVIVGARSGIFAPAPDAALIILDEEHESSYKQDQTPRYHARAVAARRAKSANATLVLGSATPSVESFYLAEQGRLKLLTMPTRIDDRPLPPVEVVDQRQEFAEGRGLFSGRLEEAICRRLARKEQIILFLNRRGFSSSLLCRDCGFTAKCPNCSVSLTYHAPQGTHKPYLQCHHCDWRQPAPTRCPQCAGDRIRTFGMGTEKVEIETARLFPDARILRLDRDTTSRKDAHRRILTKFRNEDADILIGTQMVAKGLDFPRVTLVGVVAADTGLNQPDFRAAERSFQVLTQVSGRAGRADLPGEVIVQTFNPDHYSVVAAQKHDYERFYREEIVYRRELLYPPFSYLANVIATAEHPNVAEGAVNAAAEAFRTVAAGGPVQILGPVAAPIAKLKNHYRRHVLLKAPDAAALSHVLDDALARLDDKVKDILTLDVEPQSMM
ncbi:MAG TPA: primosomal protein N' [Armatimonadota bacterium]|jgi:primosomal protein N' (replication factor Y)